MKARMPTIGARQLRVGSAGVSAWSSPSRDGYSGLALVIRGNAPVKFSAGGGDAVAHSRVHAFHGLFVARAPDRSARTPFQISNKPPTPITNAPMVSAKFSAPMPGMSG